jgi:SAM-dependent methyltransferase
MEVHQSELSDVSRYLDAKKHLTLEDMRPDYESYLRLIRRFTTLTPETSILEIGTGTGWFPLLCKLDGWKCKGLEISPQLVAFARSLGQSRGVEPDIELGNIETTDIGENCYDVIVTNSVFEHIEDWREALGRIHRALRPGGMLFFASTNKFSFVSYEHDFPLYGWLPDRWRFRLRVARQGPDIMKLGIDFNQFTYPGLRRAFRNAGFSRILDRIDVFDATRLSSWKRAAVRLVCATPPLKELILTFCDSTLFVCIR